MRYRIYAGELLAHVATSGASATLWLKERGCFDRVAQLGSGKHNPVDRMFKKHGPKFHVGSNATDGFAVEVSDV